LNDKPSNSAISIHIVVCTVCICALFGVVVQGLCVLYKIPDMNTTLSGAFMHVVDTIIGALIGMLVSTRTQGKYDGKPVPTTIENPASDPAHVTTDSIS
jgi:hypothetical protein